MELTITKKNKARAKKRRIKNEKKWIPLRVISVASLILTIFFLLIGVFAVSYGEYIKTGVCGVLFAVLLVIFVVTRSLLSNFTSHWITERLNERIWIENNVLSHFIQTSFAAGINSRNADEGGYLFKMDISSIHEAKVDEKSGRIEFKTDGDGFHYSDVVKGMIDNKWKLEDFPAVFYDYTEPSLLRTLEERGVIFSKETLDFKIRDNRI